MIGTQPAGLGGRVIEVPQTVGVLCAYPGSSPSTRFRVEQHRPVWERDGFATRRWSFLREGDLKGWYGPTQWGRAVVALRALARLPLALWLIARSDVVIVQREAMPLGPPIIEWVASKCRPVIWDVDDALWQEYVSPTAGRVPRWLRAPSAKYERLCRLADEVWAGSQVLAEWCRQQGGNVRVVPTVVEVPDTIAAEPAGRKVAWIGSHSTGEFLQRILPALAEMPDPPSVIVVGAELPLPAGLEGEVLAWSRETEEYALASARVGLYPIDRNHPLAEGKCGLKAILYMSRGVPVVATPTTTNREIVRHGRDGLLAEGPGAWASHVSRLLDDADFRQDCRRSGHARAQEHYSVGVWAPRLAEAIRAVSR